MAADVNFDLESSFAAHAAAVRCGTGRRWTKRFELRGRGRLTSGSEFLISISLSLSPGVCSQSKRENDSTSSFIVPGVSHALSLFTAVIEFAHAFIQSETKTERN